MNNKNKQRSGWLSVLQLILGIGALFGGASLMIDPTGALLGMSLSMLDRSPFPNYLIPGVMLLAVLGIMPIIISLGLIIRWKWRLADKLNVFHNMHWSWSFSLYSGFALIIWIAIQVYIINACSIIHLVYILLGLVIQVVTLLPGTQRKYRI
ncbi:hypothetical protein [Paenibacillus sp. YPG26]|uniref:hypothetical protein n=1 Tax=Paenibacillus sp. YPG26 TaxID=2878915 RepID=UPI00203D31C6|nr:hypothetical protein [Paenibacillus sp. YPG26]USB33404.1 hypothetical protein LDO05_00730 [Paenibacillus sp. YPG26]